jgi:hypothetical protein
MKTILIFDDEETFRGDLRSQLAFLETRYDIKTPGNEEFLEWMEVLAIRQREFRETGTWSGETILLDGVAVFVVDYDLFETTPFLTAENVAYLVRCFSRCGLIVSVNQYGHNTFDLTLRGHLESFADLNVGQEHLGNPNLWGEVASGLHPWHWPALPSYLDDFERRVSDVEDSLAENQEDDARICKVLGMPPDIFERLPRTIGEFLGRDPAEATFRQFVTESGNGLKYKDAMSSHDVSRDVLARVGAARISKWLERSILSGQDILVDAPHLVARYPSLMTGDIAVIETWNETTRLDSHEELGLSTDVIEPFRLKKDHWLSRPAWFWNDVRECETIVEVREPWKFEKPNWVFCEDLSLFYDGGDHKEFVADVESPYARRFVKRFADVEYQPVVRFSLQTF